MKLFGEVSAPAQHKIKQLQGILTLFVHDEDFGHEDTVPGSGMKFFFGFRCSQTYFFLGFDSEGTWIFLNPEGGLCWLFGGSQ